MEEIDGYIPRQQEEKVQYWLKQGYITAILGARQTGKTTLIKKLRSQVKQKSFYYLLDDAMLRGQIQNDFYYLQKDIETKLHTTIGKIQEEIYVFIDEAQKAPEIFELLKIWHDEIGNRIKIIISGSSSLEIQKKSAESLAGRVQYIYLSPLTLGELLPFKLQLPTVRVIPDLQKIDLTAIAELYAPYYKNRHETELFFKEMLVFGFLPAIWKNDKLDKFGHLRSVVNTYLEKDIRSLGLVRELGNFQKLLSILGIQTGQIINYENLSRQTQINVKTIKAYFAILESTFSLELLLPDTSPLDQMVKSPKAYLYDLGIANFLAKRTSIDNVLDSKSSGGIFESAILNTLLSFMKNETVPSRVYYWRDYAGHEIDFILRFGEEIIPIEVTLDSGIEKKKWQNLKYFLEKNQSVKRVFMIYQGAPQEKKIGNTRVFCLPWYLWQ